MDKIKRKPGRPRVIEDGKPIYIVVPNRLRVVALELGNGNLSAGIRKALELAAIKEIKK